MLTFLHYKWWGVWRRHLIYVTYNVNFQRNVTKYIFYSGYLYIMCHTDESLPCIINPIYRTSNFTGSFFSYRFLLIKAIHCGWPWTLEGVPRTCYGVTCVRLLSPLITVTCVASTSVRNAPGNIYWTKPKNTRWCPSNSEDLPPAFQNVQNIRRSIVSSTVSSVMLLFVCSVPLMQNIEVTSLWTWWKHSVLRKKSCGEIFKN